MSEETGLTGFFRAVTTRPVAMTMLFVAALVFGFVGYKRLPVEMMPEMAYPTITVRTAWEGAAPQEVETQVSRPIEEALATLDGLVKVESRSRADGSDVVLGFDWGTDMNGAAQTIRESLQVVFLPDGAERPLLLRYDPSLDPFLRLALAVDPAAPPAEGDRALLLLREVADEVKQDLEAMRGIAAVRVRGGLEREIRIEVREDWLTARRLTLQDVEGALAAANVNLAGGSILEGDREFLVRTLNEYRSLGEIRSLRIRRSDGVIVPITDVAEVREAARDREVVSHLDGAEAVELEVFKEADANVVEVARKVKDRLEGEAGPGSESIREALPDGVLLRVLDDQAAFIEAAITNLRDTAVLGGLMAVGILFLFLRDFRATAIIGLAIPVSVVIGFSPLYLQGVSLNLMSLGGLALGVGMLVDNAVVVLESIQRFREDGHERAEASVRGVSEVAAAVTASTLTTVAVFLPIAFVEGVAGELFGDLAIAVVASLLASLAVALLLVPTLAALEAAPGILLAVLLGGVIALASPLAGFAVGLVLVPALAGLEGAGDGEEGAVARLERFRREGGLWRLVRGLLGDALAAPADGLRSWRAGFRERRWRLTLLPWALLRFALHLVWSLGAAAVVFLSALVARAAYAVVHLAVRPLRWGLERAAAGFGGVYGGVEGVYSRLLPRTLGRSGLVVGLAAALFAVSVAAAGRLGSELVPEIHQGRFVVETALPVGTPLEENVAVLAEVEQVVAAHPEVEAVYATIGTDRRADARADEGAHTAKLRVELVEGGALDTREAQVMEDLRVALAEVPRLDVRMTRPALFSFATPVEVVLFGFDLDGLAAVGDQVAAELERLPGIRDVASSLAPGHPEVRIRYDRERLQRFGLDPATVASRVRDRVQGVESTTVQRGERQVDVRVQLVEADRRTLADLRGLNVNPELVPPIPLVAIADLEEAVGPSEIRRVDQQRAVVVGANLEGFDLGSAGTRIASTLSRMDLPHGTTWTVAGQSREMEQSLGSLRFALLLAIFLVYVIMASTFEHLVHPFVILLAVPLALVGVVGGLSVGGLALSVPVFIGLIVLAGVVVNNAIVLVDTINRRRDRGIPRLQAIAEAGRLRLRPILVTTATTVLGLLPLSLGLGAGSEIQQPLAIAVIGGLTSSTLLTLVVIPSMYALATREPAAASAVGPASDEVVP